MGDKLVKAKILNHVLLGRQEGEKEGRKENRKAGKQEGRKEQLRQCKDKYRCGN